MIRIAICDDNQEELQGIACITNKYLGESNQAAEVKLFDHPDALLKACTQESFHIFLLDMVMPMISGLELGHSIRTRSADAQIVYITTEPSLALEAYDVHPLHYLLKPLDAKALTAVLDLAVKKVNVGEESYITIKTRDGIRTLLAEKILYCEYTLHKVIYVMADGTQIDTVTLVGNFKKHIEPLLEKSCFIQPHVAFVVNMNYVEKLDKNGFMLRNRKFVPISGKQNKKVRDAYMDYRLGEV